MSFDYSTTDDSLAKGLSDLKTGALLSLVVYALIFIIMAAALALVPSLMTFTGGFAAPSSPMHIGALIGFLSLLAIAGLEILVIAILAFYKFYKASSHFKEYDPPKLGIGKTGMILELLGVVILIVGVALLLISAKMISSAGTAGTMLSGPGVLSSHWMILSPLVFVLLGLLLISLALVVIGGILFGIMVVRLAEVDGLDKGFKWAGILYIVGIILSGIPNIGIIGSLLGLVSTILMYSSSKNSLEALRGGSSQGEGYYPYRPL